MRCELCGKSINDGEVVSGYRYGEVDNIMEVFIPARDSAWMVICGKCNERMLQSAFSDQNPNTNMYTRVHKIR